MANRSWLSRQIGNMMRILIEETFDDPTGAGAYLAAKYGISFFEGGDVYKFFYDGSSFPKLTSIAARHYVLIITYASSLT